MSVWVEMSLGWNTPYLVSRSRSTWACELKYADRTMLQGADVSRSTWACELKWCAGNKSYRGRRVTLHVSVWVEICQISLRTARMTVTLHVSVWVEILMRKCITIVTGSRSTWACELKLQSVSPHPAMPPVTLHVSVWVEIPQFKL